MGGSTIDPAMLTPLFVMAGGYFAVFAIVLLRGTRKHTDD